MMKHINLGRIMTNPHKVKPYLLTRSLQPENQETPIHFINNDSLKNQSIILKESLSYPTLSYSNYWLPINGLVSAPLLLSMQDILQYPSKTVEVVLECSCDKGNCPGFLIDLFRFSLQFIINWIYLSRSSFSCRVMLLHK